MKKTTRVSYEPLWETMKRKKISTYVLIYKLNFNKGTLSRMKKGANVNISTIQQLCELLECSVEDVVRIERINR